MISKSPHSIEPASPGNHFKVVTSRHPQLSPSHPIEVLWNYHRGPEKHSHGDVHYVLQFSVVRHGHVEISYENYRRLCGPGDIWWTICWEPHAYRCLDARNLIMTVNVNLDDLGEIGLIGSSVNWLAPFSAAPEQRYCPHNVAERLHVQEWAAHLTRIYRRKPLNWLPHCWLEFHSLLLYILQRQAEFPLLEEESSGLKARLERLRPALELVRTSLVTPDLQTAAAACHLSVSRFSELFRRALGKSYGHFALRARLDHCASDLRDGNLRLKEIAARHGFCDAASLCNAFQRVFHCTPTEFLKGVAER
ncbi:MAG: helix-turn-helix transcriptional regulator [Victivallales bacterium]|nr:helix-turn-helix transcriptional regulator [Victivallales bacterium]